MYQYKNIYITKYTYTCSDTNKHRCNFTHIQVCSHICTIEKLVRSCIYKYIFIDKYKYNIHAHIHIHVHKKHYYMQIHLHTLTAKHHHHCIHCWTSTCLELLLICDYSRWCIKRVGGCSAMGTRVFGMLVQGFESGSGAAVSTESRQGQRCQDKWSQYLGMKIELLLNVWPKARIKKLDEGSSAAPSVHLHQSGKWWKSWVDRVRYSRKRDCALALSDGTVWVGISWPAADGIHGSKHEVGATASLHHAVGRKDFGAAIWHSRSFFYSWII